MVELFNSLIANFRDYNAHILQWTKLGFAPFIIWLAGFSFMATTFALTGEPVTDMTSLLLQDSTTENLWIFLSAILYFVFMLVAVLGMHINGFRYLTLGEGGDTWFTFPFDKRLLKVSLYFILISILASLYVTGTIFLASFLFSLAIDTSIVIASLIIMGTLGIYIFTRLVLTFHYISTDQEKPLRASWHRMHKRVGRFLILFLMSCILFILFSIPIGILLFIVSYLLSYVSTWLGAIFLDLVTPFAVLFFFALVMEAVVATNKETLVKK